MDAPAIKEIQKSQTTESVNEALTKLNLTMPLVAHPNDFDIESLEKFAETRNRFRGKVETKSIASFFKYAEDKKIENSTVFIDADNMKAKLVVDLGNQERPGHCEHTSFLSLEKSSAYNELLKIIDCRKSQKEIAEFIEDWRNLLTASNEPDENDVAEAVSIVKALYAIRKITIEAKSINDSETRNFGATNTSMDSIDVKSLDMPPAFFYFTCEPYLGLKQRTFTLRLSVITDRAPALVLRIVRFEEHKEEMATELQEILETGLSKAIKTYIGNFTA